MTKKNKETFCKSCGLKITYPLGHFYECVKCYRKRLKPANRKKKLERKIKEVLKQNKINRKKKK